jgi:hypothetical protein
MYPTVEPPIFTTGASVQQPRQATCSMVNSCDGSVSAPGGMFKRRRKRVLDPIRARDMTSRAAADAENMFPAGLWRNIS